jgi:hypothetical protein
LPYWRRRVPVARKRLLSGVKWRKRHMARENPRRLIALQKMSDAGERGKRKRNGPETVTSEEKGRGRENTANLILIQLVAILRLRMNVARKNIAGDNTKRGASMEIERKITKRIVMTESFDIKMMLGNGGMNESKRNVTVMGKDAP